MKFINLHQHTTYSFLDGYGQPAQYLRRLTHLKADGLALTEHGNTYSHHPFTALFKEAGKHLVYGCELYVVEKLKKERGYYHVTVLAKNNEGYKNLLKLVNLSYEEGQFYYRPRVSFNQLRAARKGLVILSGCFCDGWFVKGGSFEQWLKWFKNCEWYLEMQPFIDEQEKWHQLANLADKHGIPTLVTADAHYPRPEDKATQDVMVAINTNKLASDPDRLKMDYPLYLPSGEEMLERCKEMGPYREEWITGTHDVALSCEVDLPKTTMISVGAKIGDIEEQCLKQLKTLEVESAVYLERLAYELNLIKEKGFEDYFMIIADMVQWAKECMLVGPARGSSAGSLVCYLLRITEVDPIVHGLLFERFIDINRSDLPDIDIDFPADRRDEVIQYVYDKYNKEHVAQLITFNTFRPKAVVQDAARVLEIPRWEALKSTKQVVERSGGDSRAEFCLVDSLDQFGDLKALFDKYPKLHEALGLEGQVRQSGTHAAAVVLSSVPLRQIGSINKDGAFGIGKKQIEEYGLLKIDILGLETLSIIQDICEEVGLDYNDLYSMPLDDSKTFKVFSSGKLAGIFQLEGPSASGVCRDVPPSAFEHIVDITALSRPGPLNSGSTKDYIKRFNGEKWDIHPTLKKYTNDTLGVIIFQEQVMKIVKEVGEFSWADTSTIRKAMSKNLGEEFFNNFTNKFIAGAATHGFSEEEAKDIWGQIYTHGSWSFNKSHAVSYALLSYWTAYLKAHYPLQFYARILKGKDEEETKFILREYGGSFQPLNLSLSKAFFSTDGKRLIGGWTNIDGIGEKNSVKIVAGQPYDGIDDFASRNAKGVTKKVEQAMGGQAWADLSTIREKVTEELKEVRLSQPLSTLKETVDGKLGKSIILGQVILINLRDHNEDEKVIKRGYKMKGDAEFMMLRVQDESRSGYTNIFFDRHFTARNKQELLSLNGAICLFSVDKKEGGLLVGGKFKCLKKTT